MLLTVVLGLICVWAEELGEAKISGVELYPGVVGASAARLSFTASLDIPVPPIGTIVTVNSTVDFAQPYTAGREDCFIDTGTGGSVTNCVVMKNSLEAELSASSEADVRSFTFTVLRGFNLTRSSQLGTFYVKVMYFGTLIDASGNVEIPLLSTTAGELLNVSITMEEAMEDSLTTLNVIYVPDFSLKVGDITHLVFPSDFDPSIGKMQDSERRFSCSGAGSIRLQCTVLYGAVDITMLTEVSSRFKVNITLSNVRMPRDPTSAPIDILVLRQDVLLGSAQYVPVLNPPSLDISCCVEYSTLPMTKECTDDKYRACYSFGYNMASFSNDMNQLIVKFNQNMQVDGFRKCGAKCENCRIFFTDETAFKLKNDARCRWTDLNVLTVYLGQYPTIDKGWIYFVEGALRTINGQVWPNRSMRLIYPKRLPDPTAVITVSGEISKCGFALLDCIRTTGTGRREVKCMWYVEDSYRFQGDHLTLGMNDTFNNAPTTKVTLVTENYWGLRGESSVEVMRRDESGLIVSFPFGNSTKFYHTSQFTFQVDVQLTSCALQDKVKSLSFTWRFTPNNLQCFNRTCTVQPRSLAPGLYLVEVTVVGTGNTQFHSGGARANFEVVLSRLEIVVTGANTTVNYNEDNLLQGSGTIDTDRDRPVTMSWVLFDSAKNTNITNFGKAFTVRKGSLHPNEKYYIDVSAWIDEGDKVHALYWLQTTNQTVCKIDILKGKNVNPSDIYKVNPQQLEKDYSDVKESICEWRQITNHNFRNISSLSTPILVFAAYSLDPGLSYSFQYDCNITLSDGRKAISKTEITIIVNEPPSGGVIEVSPESGEAMKTLFNLMSYNWKDNGGNYPLKYQYATVKPGAEEDVYLPFTPALLETNFTTLLSQNMTNIYLLVCDSLGACFRCNTSVSIETKYQDTVTAEVLLNLLANATASNDTRSIITTTNLVSDTLAALLKNKQFSEEQTHDVLNSIVQTLETTANTLLAQSGQNLDTEDQETMFTSIIKAMGAAEFNQTAISILLQIAQRCLALNNTRQTTGTISVQVLSASQQFVEHGNVSKSLIDEIGSYVRALIDNLIKTLTPGQMPINATEDSASVYIVRDNSESLKHEGQDLILPLKGPVEGNYKVNIPKEVVESAGNQRVVDIIVSITRVPPANSLPDITNISLCDFSYSNSELSELAVNKTCRIFAVPISLGNLETIYPIIFANNSGQYGIITGNLEGTESSRSLNVNGTSVVQSLPIVATWHQRFQCLSLDNEGLVTNEVCEEIFSAPNEVVCKCKSLVGAFVKPVEDVKDVIPLSDKPWPGNFAIFITGDSYSGIIVTLLTFLIIYCLYSFSSIQAEKNVTKVRDLKAEYKEIEQELTSELASLNCTVKCGISVKSIPLIVKCSIIWIVYVFLKPMWCLRCSLFYQYFNHQKSYYTSRYRKLTTRCSLDDLFNQFLSKQLPKHALHSAIGNALQVIKSKNDKWHKCEVMDTFLYRMKNGSCLTQFVYTYFQYRQNLVRSDYLVSRKFIPENHISYHQYSTDDVLRMKVPLCRRMYWQQFLRNNEFLSFFFCVSAVRSNKGRIPILMINFLAALASQAENYKNFNEGRVKGVGDLVSDSYGKVWNEVGWKVTIVLTVCFTAFTMLVEKLIVIINPNRFMHKEAVIHFPHGTSHCIDKTKKIFARYIPILLCLFLFIDAILAVINNNLNDTTLILLNTLQSLAVGIFLGFHVIAAVVTLITGRIKSNEKESKENVIKKWALGPLRLIQQCYKVLKVAFGENIESAVDKEQKVMKDKENRIP